MCPDMLQRFTILFNREALVEAQAVTFQIQVRSAQA
jgi:hypothetical protein